MTRVIVAVLAVSLSSATAFAADAVVGARVHPVDGPVIENGVVVWRDGQITAVGDVGGVDIAPGTNVIDGAGLDLWPSLIDGRTRLGLVEIGAIRATRDYAESGPMNPNARAAVAINPSSELIPVTRANGVLLAGTAPAGGRAPGTAAVIGLSGWTWEEMARVADAGVVINWPGMGPRRPSSEEGEEEDDRATAFTQIAELSDMLDEARAYAQADDRDADVCWASLVEVVQGGRPLWIHASSEAQIRAAIDWTARENVRWVLVDGGGAWRCAEALAAAGVPVMTKSIRMPQRSFEPYDTPYTAPARLHEAGVKICFYTGDASNARNLPHEAARAAAYGLPREIAERALTLSTAEVLGIDDRYGSITPGKSATMILVEGDVLDGRMQVRRAWLDGGEVDLSSRHTRLFEKYRGRPSPQGYVTVTLRRAAETTHTDPP